MENTVGKGEIARYEQFLLFPQCFQVLYCRHVKTRALQNIHKRYQNMKLTKLSTAKSWLLIILRKIAFENIVGIGGNASNHYFLLFSHIVLYPSENKFQFLDYIYFVVYVDGNLNVLQMTNFFF